MPQWSTTGSTGAHTYTCECAVYIVVGICAPDPDVVMLRYLGMIIQ